MDGAVLLVAADDGMMPQTRQHLLLAKNVRNLYSRLGIRKDNDKDIRNECLISYIRRTLYIRGVSLTPILLPSSS